MMPGKLEQQIWEKLLEMTGTLGDLKSEIATCAANILAQTIKTGELAEHQREQNGNATHILNRLVALELANATDCGEIKGARHQWMIISGSLITGAALVAILTFVGIVAGWW